MSYEKDFDYDDDFDEIEYEEFDGSVLDPKDHDPKVEFDDPFELYPDITE